VSKRLTGTVYEENIEKVPQCVRAVGQCVGDGHGGRTGNGVWGSSRCQQRRPGTGTTS
jgi:hypothetical protein